MSNQSEVHSPQSSGDEQNDEVNELEVLKEINEQQAAEVERLKKEVEELKISPSPQASSLKLQASPMGM